MARLAHLLALALLLLLAAACGTEAESVGGSPSATPEVKATPSPSVTPAPPVTSSTPPPVVATPTPSAPTTSTPTPPLTPVPPSPIPTAPPAIVPVGPRVEVLAPIEGVEVFSPESGRATARITSGLPSGCAVYSRAIATRTADVVRVEVYNHQPTGMVACTAIYGYVTKDVPLGSGFALGLPYTIEVNGTRQQFTLR